MTIDFQGIRQSFPIAETIGRYLELKRQGGEYKARCPFHNDRNPSFAVVPAKGKAFCNACGWAGDVVDFIAEFEAVELAEAARRLTGDKLPTERPQLPALPPDESSDWTPIWPVPDDAPAFDPAKVYNPRRAKQVSWQRILTRQDAYRDADGRLLGYVLRLEIDGNKLTPAVTYARHRDGRACWAAVKFPEPTPLQGLDELARRPQAPVLVVSGEKCREAAAKALPGFVVVTWVGGDNRVGKADWTPLRERNATFWPDADPSGIQAMHELARLACAQTARMLDASGLAREFGKGADVADLVAAGWDTARIIEWAKQHVGPWEPPTEPVAEPPHEPEPDPPIEQDHAVTNEPKQVNGHAHPILDAWPEPINLTGTFEPPVVRADWIPPQLVKYVFDQSELLGCDPSILAVSCIVACAAAIHDGIEIQPKRHDPTWRESARLWGAIVGEPSTRKTPAIKKATSHLRKIDMQLAETSAGKMADFERELKVYKKREAAYVNADAKGDATGSPPEAPEAPACERLLAEDITIEAMSNVLKDNARGVMVITDELSGWFGSMDAYKGAGGKDRGLWLEIYNGGPKRVDRVMRGSLLVPNWSASIMGGIQPEAIRKVSGQLYDDGLLQRFMVVVGKGLNNASQDRTPDMDALKAYRDMIDDLFNTKPSDNAVTLSEGAHRWREAVSEFSHGLVQADMLTPSFRSHLGKWDGLFARLLLVFHVIEARAQRKYPTLLQVSEATARRVHDFMRYFLFPHAASFYMGVMARSDRDTAVEWLADWILAERHEAVTLREVMQSYKRWRAMPDWQQRLVMRSLEDAGWLLAVDTTTERRVNRWEVNPKVHELFGKRAIEAKARREQAREDLRQAFTKPSRE